MMHEWISWHLITKASMPYIHGLPVKCKKCGAHGYRPSFKTRRQRMHAKKRGVQIFSGHNDCAIGMIYNIMES